MMGGGTPVDMSWVMVIKMVLKMLMGLQMLMIMMMTLVKTWNNNGEGSVRMCRGRRRQHC